MRDDDGPTPEERIQLATVPTVVARNTFWLTDLAGCAYMARSRMGCAFAIDVTTESACAQTTCF